MSYNPEKQNFPNLNEQMSSQDAGEENNEQEKKEQIAERYRQYEALGEVVLGGVGFRVKVDESVETFYFDAESKEIGISPALIEQKKLNESEQLYAFIHEIAHFVQMSQSPDQYLGTFEKAKEEAKQWPPEQQEKIEKAWRKYYNIFKDIHDNSIVEGRLPKFQNIREEDHPRKSLYRKLFIENDLSQQPKHLQFCYAALRRAMLPEEEVKIEDSVREKLDTPFSYMGRKYNSLQDFINTQIYSPDSSFSSILFRLDNLIEPSFREFLKEDADNNNLEQPSGTFDINDFGKEVSDSDIKKIIKEIKESQKSASERASDKAKQSFNQNMQEAGFSEKEVKRMHEIREKADSVYHNLVDLWEVFLHTTYHSERVEEDGFRSGKDFSVKQFVKQIPTIITDPGEARVFRRKTLEKMKESTDPRKIDLHLILDLSGSMDDQKRRAVQEATYAISKSLIQFRRNLSVRNNGESPVDISLQINGFGSETKELLELSEEEKQEQTLSDEDSKNLDKRLWEAVMKIQQINLGGTEDDKPLHYAQQLLNKKDVQRELNKDREAAVLLEITDGETMTQDASRRIVNEIDSMKNVYPRGIRIPGLISSDEPSERGREKPETHIETGAFENVWGKKGTRLSDVGDLRKVMQKILFQAIGQKNK
jgi:hypothetical protein